MRPGLFRDMTTWIGTQVTEPDVGPFKGDDDSGFLAARKPPNRNNRRQAIPKSFGYILARRYKTGCKLMCLIVFAHQLHSRYPLILAANRDEFYQRPTAPAHWWEQQPGLLAGRDMLLGGTWLGISRNGRFAAVTNYREGRQPAALRSRGELTLDFLAGHDPALAHALRIRERNHEYNGYNLLLYDGNQLVYCSNRHTNIEPLPPGLYGLSNHLLNTPWPKVRLTKDLLQKLISQPTLHTEQLLHTVSSRKPFSNDELPNTGVSSAWERSLSPPFVDTGEYGTRSSTGLLIDQEGNVSFVEQNYKYGKVLGTSLHYSFRTEA